MVGNALVLGASKGFGFSIGVLVENIVKNSAGVFSEAIIFAEELTLRDKEIISSNIPAQFRKFDSPISAKALRNSPYLRYFTPFSLTKVECFRLLRDFDTVTWLDTDIVVRRDLAPLVEISPTGAKFMMGSSFREQLLGNAPSGYDGTAPALFTGTFSLSRNLRSAESIYESAYRFLREYSDLLYLPDQAAITAAFLENGVNPDPIEARLFAPHPSDFSEDAFILHAYGRKKFWSGLSNDDWTRNYGLWLERGGTPYVKPGPRRKTELALLKLDIRLHRLRLNLAKNTSLQQKTQS